MNLHERVLAQTALLAAASASACLGFAGLVRAADQPAAAPVLVAQAQSPAAEAPTAQGGATAEGQLEEVVITATHFTTAANETPLSVSTVTVGQLNEQGINTFNNLIGVVPSVLISASTTPSVVTISIRGIIQSNGAATTGFYLDDTPLQAYANGSASAGSGNGTPLPPIFDLQRVEVLEGPQGTLFGASSEGGTIRYITPEPSLQNWQAYAKLDGSQTQHADGQNYDAGVAFGGPIIPGVLGFRASVAESTQAGWIQMEDPNSQAIVGTGLNQSKTLQFHGALLWKPTDQFSAKASFFTSEYSTPYFGNSYNNSEPYPIVEPALGFNTTAATPATPVGYPTPVCVGAAACAAYKGTITYIRPAATTGPYSLAPFTVIGASVGTNSPDNESIEIPSLDLTWELPRFTVQLFSSYLRAIGEESLPNTVAVTPATYDVTEGPNTITTGMTFLPGDPNVGNDQVTSRNARNMWAEDLRFSSIQGPTQLGAGLLSWTAGLYYQDEWVDAAYGGLFPSGGIEALSQYLYGITPAQRYGIPPFPYTGGLGPTTQPYLTENINAFHEWISNTDVAVYAEANYNITNHLQATVGVRESKTGLSFLELHYGETTSGIAVPTVANGGTTGAANSETAFTPKGELTYRFSNDKLLYLLVDKGFRPGGPNSPLGVSCMAGVATYGLTIYQTPLAFGPDSDWNTELGTKLSLANGRVQLNADVYRLLWSNVQATITPAGCGSPITTNAGDALSTGVEFSGQAIAAKGLLLNWAFGYDHAYYTETGIALHGAPGFPNAYSGLTGQDFNIVPWTSTIGARLDLASAFGIGGSDHPYVRADWTLQGGHDQSTYGISTYDPYTNHVGSIPLLNVRAGFNWGPIDLNIYALNATGSLAGTRSGGPTGCKNPACTTYTSTTPFTGVTPANYPRTIGVQFTYNR